MEEKAVNDWLDIAPEYLNFLLTFMWNPPRAFAEVAGSGKISRAITSILLGGVGFSYLIVLTAASPDLRKDTGKLAHLLRGLDYRLLPVAAVLLFTALGVVSHLAGKGYASLSKLGTKRVGKWDPKLGGAVEDSVNAAAGFAAVFVPFAAALLCAASWWPMHPRLGMMVAAGFPAVMAIVYFPWSLKSTHPHTGFFQAYFAFSGGLVLFVLVLTGLMRLVKAI